MRWEQIVSRRAVYQSAILMQLHLNTYWLIDCKACAQFSRGLTRRSLAARFAAASRLKAGASRSLHRRFSRFCPIAGADSPAIPLLSAYLRSFAGVSIQETTMPDQNTPASGFQYSLTNLKPAEPVDKIALTFPGWRQARIPQGHHRPRDRQGHFAVAGQTHRRDGAGWRGRRPQRPDLARCQDRVHQPRRSARAGTDPA